MVQGIARHRRRFREAPKIIHERLVRGMERIADEVVADMQVLNPLPRDIVIEWTWGNVPRGAISVASFGRNQTDALTITIYATTKSGSGFAAHWFEFGTNPRFQKTTGRYTGRITAQPFFFPTWRANRRNIRNRLNGILRRALKKANQL